MRELCKGNFRTNEDVPFAEDSILEREEKGSVCEEINKKKFLSRNTRVDREREIWKEPFEKLQ